MKNILIVLLLLPLIGVTQTLENIDYISPFHNEVAAVKKGTEWAFINKEGETVIDFRNDLVLTKTDNENYPIFNSERSLIASKKKGITYFGYIDKSGKTVIEPQFLNATNFKNDVAVVLNLVKKQLGGNELMKNVVSYHYFEVVIEKDGKLNQYLTEDPIHITLTKEKMKNTPVITSKLISNNLVAVKANNNKWILKKIK